MGAGASAQTHLTADNYSRLMQLAAAVVAGDVERAILRNRCNAVPGRAPPAHPALPTGVTLTAARGCQLGAFVIDADVRALMGYFSGASRWAARDHFARLAQMALLLTLEKAADVSDVWIAREWRLSATEARQVLALRVEFGPDELQRLRL
jgi:hypothetical protein